MSSPSDQGVIYFGKYSGDAAATYLDKNGVAQTSTSLATSEQSSVTVNIGRTDRARLSVRCKLLTGQTATIRLYSQYIDTQNAALAWGNQLLQSTLQDDLTSAHNTVQATSQVLTGPLTDADTVILTDTLAVSGVCLATVQMGQAPASGEYVRLALEAA